MASGIAIALGSVLSLLILLLWAFVLNSLTHLTGSDPAGNALTQGFTALAIFVLWALLGALAIIALVRGAMPLAAALAALLLIPASGWAAIAALDLLARPQFAPFYWPMIVPAGVPPLVVAFCFWTLLPVPALHRSGPANTAAGIAWGAVLILSLAILPMRQVRDQVYAQQAAEQAKWDAALASMPADAPLWDLISFLATARGETKQEAVLDRIKNLDRRQSDAEIMLDRGDFPLGYLGRFGLNPTPAICDKARNLLRQRVKPLVLSAPGAKPYDDIYQDVADAVAAMKWLVGYGCSCDAESLAWETMAKAYRDPGWDVRWLADLRDPKALGRVLNEDPEQFSMLTPKAHLRAWLKFADPSTDSANREQALAGARQLDHRTADAIEMLSGGHPDDPSDEYSAYVVLRDLPVLDLEPTSQLCAAAGTALHHELGQIYPPRDDPRPYWDLLEGPGAEKFTALIWLAEHGCDMDAELSQAEALVQAYRDSPRQCCSTAPSSDRADMLAKLAGLHRKP
ncbi:MAG TPA: hypothetical protein VM782_01640 [Stellaceae bacterium]|nr:hypothetical protein [Stellaceae bacterium]